MAAATGIRMRSSRGRLHRDQLLLRLDHVGRNREKGGDRTGGARGREFDSRLAAVCVQVCVYVCKIYSRTKKGVCVF